MYYSHICMGLAVAIIIPAVPAKPLQAIWNAFVSHQDLWLSPLGIWWLPHFFPIQADKPHMAERKLQRGLRRSTRKSIFKFWSAPKRDRKKRKGKAVSFRVRGRSRAWATGWDWEAKVTWPVSIAQLKRGVYLRRASPWDWSFMFWVAWNAKIPYIS